MTPTPGRVFICNGFRIRVDFVASGQVFVSRWALDRQAEYYPRKIRVALDVWDREMAEAQEVKS